MQDVKELIDQYAAENQALRQQLEGIGMLLRDVVVMKQDEKGQIRLTGKIRKQGDKFGLEIRQLKTSVVLTVKEKQEEV